MIPSSYRPSAARRIQHRLRRVEATCLTGMATAWCVTLGPVPGIIALLVAKHVLVALLVAGIDHEREESPGQHGSGVGTDHAA